jgi:iron-sulfur cluster insertion protein
VANEEVFVTDPAFEQAMSLTESAAQKLRALRTEEGNDNLKLRVYITGGGCAGFSYGFKFDEVVNEGDTSVLRDDVTMVVDELSIQYLAGSTVDYVEGLQGARFVIANPNASSTCGCGSSFSV